MRSPRRRRPVSETEALQMRIAELEAENARLRGEDPKALPSPESERVITPTESEVIPPGEIGVAQIEMVA